MPERCSTRLLLRRLVDGPVSKLVDDLYGLMDVSSLPKVSNTFCGHSLHAVGIAAVVHLDHGREFGLPLWIMPDTNTRPGAGKQCYDCGRPLRPSIDSEKGWFKSCPNCSGFAVDYHAFRRHDEFGTTLARRSNNRPGGDQSWCRKCRELNLPHWAGKVNEEKYVRCRDVREEEFSRIRPKAPIVRRKQ
jgi:hypothetical protein